MKWECEDKPVNCEPPPPPEDCEPPPPPPPPEDCEPPPPEDCEPPPPPEDCDPPPPVDCDPPPTCPPTQDCPVEECEPVTNDCNDGCPAPDNSSDISIIDNILNNNSILSGDILSGNITQIGDILSPDISTGDITLIGGDANVLSGPIASVIGSPIGANVLSDLVSVGDVTDTLDLGNQLVNVLGDVDVANVTGLLSGNDGNVLQALNIGDAIASLSTFDLSDATASIFDTDLSNVGAITSIDASNFVLGAVDALVAEADLFNIDIPIFDIGSHG